MNAFRNHRISCGEPPTDWRPMMDAWNAAIELALEIIEQAPTVEEAGRLVAKLKATDS